MSVILNLELDDSNLAGTLKVEDRDSAGFFSCGVIVIAHGLVLELVSTGVL